MKIVPTMFGNRKSASTTTNRPSVASDADSASGNDVTSTEDAPLGKTLSSFKDQQSTVLPRKKLLVVFPALAGIQFLSFLDQTSTSTALPAIANGLSLGTDTAWVGASFLVASTSIQLITGRLSDIFGRKICLIVAIVLLGLGNLLAGFAHNPATLFAGRSVSGLGAGAINGLVQTSVSDITTLEQRGNYFGFIGAAVALGNGIGPLVAGSLTQNASWRWSLWFITPMTAVVLPIIMLVLPATHVTGSPWQKIKLVDWLGCLVNTAATVLVLVPISLGGGTLAWVSPAVLVTLVVGILMGFAFVLVEWKFAKLPIVPLRLFENGWTANGLLVQSIFIGWVYWGNLFYLPLYFQNVRGWSPLYAGVLILPMTIASGCCSALSGFLVSRYKNYKWPIITGAVFWTIGSCCQLMYSPTTPIGVIVVVGLLQGIGVGFSLQPTLVGLLANSLKADRAVMTGLRNFGRAFGGAIGLTVSGTILNNVVSSKLNGKVPEAVIKQVASSVFSLQSLHLSTEQQDTVLSSYMDGLHGVFISYCPLMIIFLLYGLAIKDSGLEGKEQAVVGLEKAQVADRNPGFRESTENV